VRPGAFVFCERVSGAMRFKVEAARGGSLPVEKAASLLAMHCLVRGLTPCDYTVLVVPRGTLLDSVGQRAQELLDLGRAIGTGVRLSPREREVLECVLMNKSNKEIGSQLNICERTVKFHVSALLAKFNVRDRAGLVREATVGLLPKNDLPAETAFSLPVIARQDNKNVPQGAGLSRVLRMTRNQSFA
jgi:DNA-binding CsgD family transcriptional regulator